MAAADSDFVTVDDMDFTDTPQEPPKRRRRRTKAEMAAGEFIVGDGAVPVDSAPKRTRQARSKKLTGKHVAEAVSKGSSLIVMATQEGHWFIPEAEVTPWANEAADLMNRIPSSYIEGFVSLSGIATVAFGIYSIAAPRAAISAQNKAAKKAAQTVTYADANVGSPEQWDMTG